MSNTAKRTVSSFSLIKIIYNCIYMIANIELSCMKPFIKDGLNIYCSFRPCTIYYEYLQIYLHFRLVHEIPKISIKGKRHPLSSCLINEYNVLYHQNIPS